MDRSGDEVSRIAAAILSMEAIVVLLAIPAALALSEVSTAGVWLAGGGVALLCIVGAATVRRGRPGYVIGSIAQVAAVGVGLLVPWMFVLGGSFALMWFILLRIGPDVERAKSAREAKG